jgi:hypothetical protein
MYTIVTFLRDPHYIDLQTCCTNNSPTCCIQHVRVVSSTITDDV